MRRLTQNKTILLYLGMLLNVILGFGIAKLNTAYLSVEFYGMLSLFINLVLFFRVFFSLGVFESASRLIAIDEDNANKRNLFGAILFYTFVLGIILNLVVLVSSFLVDSIFEVKIGFLLKTFWPLSLVLLFQNMLLIILRGLGYIKRLSLFYFLSRFIYLSLLFGLIYSGIFQLENTIFSYFISILVSALIFSIILKPSFVNLTQQIKVLYEEIITYGRHLYVANIISAFFQHIDKLLLAYFLDAKALGYYALAYTISAPIPYFSNALSTSAFREFANSDKITIRKISINTFYVLSITTAFLLLNRFIVETLFSVDFLPARSALYILTIAFAFNALSIPYTMFFKAQKFGKEIKNIALITQIVFLVVNFSLIPILGINGAAIATLCAFGLDYLLYFIFYRKRMKNAGSL